jgi:RimJ/RimL family protein N-acetyltransferase
MLALEGQLVSLVPYMKEHVPVYHEWMKDEYLQHETCSEPLTLEEEYQMQQTWMNDQDKLTFILASKHFPRNQWGNFGGIIGDVNLFISSNEAEIEVMIAEAEMRRQGIAKEALLIMMSYGASLGITRFFCRINATNHASINLFSGLGFTKESYSEIFKQITMQTSTVPSCAYKIVNVPDATSSRQ